MDVTVKLTGTLAVRTGAHQARLGIPEDATVADAVEVLSRRYGPTVRTGVLDGERLRADTRVVRETARPGEALTADSRLRAGDVVRFSLTG